MEECIEVVQQSDTSNSAKVFSTVEENSIEEIHVNGIDNNVDATATPVRSPEKMVYSIEVDEDVEFVRSTDEEEKKMDIENDESTNKTTSSKRKSAEISEPSSKKKKSNPSSPDRQNDSESENKKCKNEESGDKEAQRTLPLLEKYWKAVKDDPTDFTGWTYLLQYVDQANDSVAVSEVYNDFLSRYPYCYGYWRKYADYLKKHGDESKCDEIFEKGVKAIPLSVDLWIHYLSYATERHVSNEDAVRELFEKSLKACSLEFRSDRLWDAYVKWELERGQLLNVTKIFDRWLTVPTQGYVAVLEKFKDHVKKNPANKIIDPEEFFSLRSDVLSESKANNTELESKLSDEAPPGEETPDKLEKMNEEETNMLKEKIINLRKEKHELTQKEAIVRWTYEENIKRPFFHVKPLEQYQLSNWKNYLDFEIKEGSQARIITLFERCLIACALYEEFWIKFTNYLQSLPDISVEKVRDVFVRACTIHHPTKLNIHLKWATFEESYGNSLKAALILETMDKQYPNVLAIMLRRLNIIRRCGEYDKVCLLYEEFIKSTADKKYIGSSLSIKYARFCSKILNDIPKAIGILETALENNKDNCRLITELIDTYMLRNPVDTEKIANILENASSKFEDPEKKLLFAQSKFEFLEEFSNDCSVVQKAQDAYDKLVKMIAEKNKLAGEKFTEWNIYPIIEEDIKKGTPFVDISLQQFANLPVSRDSASLSLAVVTQAPQTMMEVVAKPNVACPPSFIYKSFSPQCANVPQAPTCTPATLPYISQEYEYLFPAHRLTQINGKKYLIPRHLLLAHRPVDMNGHDVPYALTELSDPETCHEASSAINLAVHYATMQRSQPPPRVQLVLAPEDATNVQPSAELQPLEPTAAESLTADQVCAIRQAKLDGINSAQPASQVLPVGHKTEAAKNPQFCALATPAETVRMLVHNYTRERHEVRTAITAWLATSRIIGQPVTPVGQRVRPKLILFSEYRDLIQSEVMPVPWRYSDFFRNILSPLSCVRHLVPSRPLLVPHGAAPGAILNVISYKYPYDLITPFWWILELLHPRSLIDPSPHDVVHRRIRVTFYPNLLFSMAPIDAVNGPIIEVNPYLPQHLLPDMALPWVKSNEGSGRALAYTRSAILLAPGEVLPVWVAEHTQIGQELMWGRDAAHLIREVDFSEMSVTTQIAGVVVTTPIHWHLQARNLIMHQRPRTEWDPCTIQDIEMEGMRDHIPTNQYNVTKTSMHSSPYSRPLTRTHPPMPRRRGPSSTIPPLLNPIVTQPATSRSKNRRRILTARVAPVAVPPQLTSMVQTANSRPKRRQRMRGVRVVTTVAPPQLMNLHSTWHQRMNAARMAAPLDLASPCNSTQRTVQPKWQRSPKMAASTRLNHNRKLPA